ncbi:hypothetical protein ES703_00369 [subsurface metagenome]
MLQELVPRYFKCIDCGSEKELTEEEVCLLLPFIKSEKVRRPVNKTVKGYCEKCAGRHLGKVERTCLTMDVMDLD